VPWISDTIPKDLSKLKPEDLLAIRDRARSDRLFLANAVLNYDFIQEVHGELFETLPQWDPTKPWAQQPGAKKRLILWSRGFYKTTAVIVTIIQLILNFPDVRVMLMQSTMRTTQSLLREIVAHFMSDALGSRLAELFPEFCGDKKALKSTASAFTVPARKRKQLKEATVTCFSEKASKTGQHADILFADDLVTLENYRSPKKMEGVRANFYGAYPLLDPPQYIVVTGTRYSHTDLYIGIIKADATKREWTVSVKTCYLDDGKGLRFPQQLKRNGEYMGFTHEILTSIRDADPEFFCSQYLNQPASTASQQFTGEMLDGRLIDPRQVPETLSAPILFFDMSSGGANGDDSVILLASTDHLGKVYVTFVRGGKWSTHEKYSHLMHVMLRDPNPATRPQQILLEKSAAGKIFVDAFRDHLAYKGLYLPIDFLEADVQADAKKVRVEALKPQFNQNRVFFVRGLEAWPKIREQFDEWTGEKGNPDDYPDTVALAVQYFTKNVPLIKPLSDYKIPFLEAIERSEAVKVFAPSDVNHASDDAWDYF
jgi:hypothetical protein